MILRETNRRAARPHERVPPAEQKPTSILVNIGIGILSELSGGGCGCTPGEGGRTGSLLGHNQA
jgi:hypothetical protein